MYSKEYMEEKGWSTWYHEDYWINPKLSSLDHTKCGMDFKRACSRQEAWEQQDEIRSKLEEGFRLTGESKC